MAKIFNSVDFPAPFGPNSPTTPCLISNDRSSRVLCLRNRLLKCSALTRMLLASMSFSFTRITYQSSHRFPAGGQVWWLDGTPGDGLALDKVGVAVHEMGDDESL